MLTNPMLTPRSARWFEFDGRYLFWSDSASAKRHRNRAVDVQGEGTAVTRDLRSKMLTRKPPTPHTFAVHTRTRSLRLAFATSAQLDTWYATLSEAASGHVVDDIGGASVAASSVNGDGLNGHDAASSHLPHYLPATVPLRLIMQGGADISSRQHPGTHTTLYIHELTPPVPGMRAAVIDDMKEFAERGFFGSAGIRPAVDGGDLRPALLQVEEHHHLRKWTTKLLAQSSEASNAVNPEWGSEATITARLDSVMDKP